MALEVAVEIKRWRSTGTVQYVGRVDRARKVCCCALRFVEGALALCKPARTCLVVVLFRCCAWSVANCKRACGGDDGERVRRNNSDGAEGVRRRWRAT